jgi:UDP-glucose 4-epimerase
MPKILLTGGCGYIGSHIAVDLLQNGYEVISIDNFFTSDKSVIKGIEEISKKKFQNFEFDICDINLLNDFFNENKNIDGIIHLAAFRSVPESVSNPIKYYNNNIISLTNILKMMKKNNIKNLIFSSSCTVYGNPESIPVTELTPYGNAESPYGKTKQICEWIIQDFCKVNTTINAVLLRYFNPAGAHSSALIGENPQNISTALAPIINETVSGKRKQMYVHGTDYNTRDGSCIRDFIHVMDLANAHTKCFEYLFKNNNITNIDVFNVGTGKGYTVLESIFAFEKANNITVNYTLGPRREGDVEAIYSDYTKAKNLLQWTPKYSLEDIMKSSWEWQKQVDRKQ